MKKETEVINEWNVFNYKERLWFKLLSRTPVMIVFHFILWPALDSSASLWERSYNVIRLGSKQYTVQMLSLIMYFSAPIQVTSSEKNF